jgi:hypothetical protein
MSANDKNQERARREAERRASERRARLEAAGAFGSPTPPAAPGPTEPPHPSAQRPLPTQPPAGQPVVPVRHDGIAAHLEPSRTHDTGLRVGFPGAVPLLSIAFAVSAAMTVLTGFPVAGHGWSPVGLVPAVAAAGTGYLLRRALAGAGFGARTFAVTAAAVTALIAVLGVSEQVVVQDRPVLRNSIEDRSYRLASRIVYDLKVLEENGKLLDLPAEQARGVANLYEAAIAQDLEIAARWNPATAGELPLPGFATVFDLVNRLADLQARTLGSYRDDLQQPDPARQQGIAEARVQIAELLTGPEGAAVTLANTVAPLGIELTVEEDR